MPAYGGIGDGLAGAIALAALAATAALAVLCFVKVVGLVLLGPPRRDEVDPPMRLALLHDRRFAGLEVRRYDWDQTYTAAEYRRLMLSYSATQSMEPATRECLLDDMEAFVREQFDDRVTRPLVVTLTTAASTP